MRKPIYAANWKMNHTAAQTAGFFSEFIPSVGKKNNREIIVAPPFTSLNAAVAAARGTGILIAGQNMHFEPKGSFTGEVSAEMLIEAGCAAVILGHSERRHVFGERDELVNKKIKAALSSGLRPIFCIGETIEQRQAGRTEDVLRRQVAAGLQGITADQASDLVIAYEPVWAIGKGRQAATASEAEEAHKFVRGLLRKVYGNEIAETTRILYGGNVKPLNITELMEREEIDGVLVGGAGLEAESFAAIVNHP